MATIITGEVDFADICFLVAVILFAVVAVIRGMGRNVDGTLTAAGLAALSLGYLVL